MQRAVIRLTDGLASAITGDNDARMDLVAQWPGGERVRPCDSRRMDDVTQTGARHEPAGAPEDLGRLLLERLNAGDAVGLAALYEPDAVLAFPPGWLTRGREAIRAVYEELLAD